MLGALCIRAQKVRVTRAADVQYEVITPRWMISDWSQYFHCVQVLRSKGLKVKVDYCKSAGIDKTWLN